MHKRRTVLAFLTYALLALAALLAFGGGLDPGSRSVYGLLVFAILSAKLLTSARHRPVERPGSLPDVRVLVTVPFFNEDSQLLRRCLLSVAGQSRLPDRLHVIDDGSSSPDAREAVRALLPELRRKMEVEFTVKTSNEGKRAALADGFRADPRADVFVTMDSDSVLHADAVREVIKPLADPGVAGVSGMVVAANRDRNLLTRLLDIRYVNAFLYERAAYSVAGAVLCACGALAAYRADVIRGHLDDFVNQRFLGMPATFGDDRRLTNYALQHGRVVLQETAVGYTAVPERLGHFVRQQVRWNKSFFRESLWVINSLPLRSPAFWLTMLELVSWMVFSIMLIAALVLYPLRTGNVLIGSYVLYMALMGYARSVRYLEMRHEGVSALARVGTYLLSPLYGVLHLVLLMPLRFYSLATLRTGSWGTRSQVEVAA